MILSIASLNCLSRSSFGTIITTLSSAVTVSHVLLLVAKAGAESRNRVIIAKRNAIVFFMIILLFLIDSVCTLTSSPFLIFSNLHSLLS